LTIHDVVAVCPEDRIQWETEMRKALNRAKAEGKPTLLDFFNPG
jgi:hypothetical protein